MNRTESAIKTRLELRGGFEVLAAEDTEKGSRLAATEHPDVILLDLEVPDAIVGKPCGV